MKDFYDLDQQGALRNAAEKGWLSVLTAASGKAGINDDDDYRRLIEIAQKKATDEEKDRYAFDKAFLGLKAAIQNADSDKFETFEQTHGKMLKTVLGSKDGPNYQEELDKMLVSAIEAHTEGCRKYQKNSDDLGKFVNSIMKIENSILSLGASASYNNYQALKKQKIPEITVCEGRRRQIVPGVAVCNPKIFNALVGDHSQQKEVALKDLFTRIATGHDPDYIKKYSKLSGVPLSILGLESLKTENAALLDVLAPAFKDSTDKSKILNDRLKNVLRSITEDCDQSSILQSLTKAGADILQDDFKAVKIVARQGYGDALATMLDHISNSDTKSNVMNEAVIEAVKGRNLDIIKQLCEQGADLTANNYAAWEALEHIRGDDARAIRTYIKSQGGEPEQATVYVQKPQTLSSELGLM